MSFRAAWQAAIPRQNHFPIARGDTILPYDVPANEYMNFGGQKASKSAGIGTTVPDLLKAFDPDPIRYYLTANAPENSDSDYSSDELIRRNNDELVAAWGNLVNRTLTFTQRYFDGKVPGDGTTDPHLTPNLIAGALTIAQVSARFDHACGVTAAHAAYCWGTNDHGQLGDGTTTPRLAPTPVIQ